MVVKETEVCIKGGGVKNVSITTNCLHALSIKKCFEEAQYNVWKNSGEELAFDSWNFTKNIEKLLVNILKI